MFIFIIFLVLRVHGEAGGERDAEPGDHDHQVPGGEDHQGLPQHGRARRRDRGQRRHSHLQRGTA